MVTDAPLCLPSAWLAVDVGNSRVKLGVFSSGRRPDGLPDCLLFLTARPGGMIDWAALRQALGDDGFGSVIVGSNQQGVDAVLDVWPRDILADGQSEALREWPIVFRDSRRFPIEADVETPRRVGLDRLLTAVAANRLRSSHDAAIVVDCGTATTVDLISARGVFLGGAILPGFALCAKGLHHYTEVLPFVSMRELTATDASGRHPAFGRSTHAAISSGIFWGQVGAVRELIHRQSAALQAGSPQVFVTGGGGELLHRHLEHTAFCPYLALQGLIIAAEARMAAVAQSELPDETGL